jgi:hypothetical protein
LERLGHAAAAARELKALAAAAGDAAASAAPVEMAAPEAAGPR